MNKITVFAPGSVANVSCGFDIMGFSIEEIGDYLTLSVASKFKETTLEIIGPYGHLIPIDISKNSATVSINTMLRALNISDLKYEVILNKQMPLGSGMGSSASSSAAAVFAMNELLDKPFQLEELIQFAMEGERIACGSAHADNVAPSLLGGFVLIRSYDPLDVIHVPCPSYLYSVVVCPEIELHTKDARRILNKEISIENAIQQSANTAGLILGLMTRDYKLIGRSMNDVLAEPKRMQLIPGFEKVKEKAMNEGAIGCGISGSGPSIFALCLGEAKADQIKQVMMEGFQELGIKSSGYIGQLNANGVRIVKEKEDEILQYKR